MIRGLISLYLLLALVAPGQAADLSSSLGERRGNLSVKSLVEIRDQNRVRQQWDLSCGAAALSTILTHHFGAEYSELTIAISILANTDPEKVQAAGGFSLLDLKRFAEAVGYSAKGYGGLTLTDLAESSVPVILPVRIRGFDHFVVYRGRFAGRVLIGDPAFGNLTLSEKRFAKIWRSGIGFFVTPPDSDAWTGEMMTPEEMGLVVPNLNYVNRLARGSGPNPLMRRPRPTGGF